MRKLLPWILGAALAIPVVLPVAAPGAALAQNACVTASPSPSPSPSPLLMPEDARLALFDQVWGQINDNYLDPTFNGNDWNAIGDQYAPLFLQVEDAYEIYALTSEMVSKLGDDEVRFIDPVYLENLPPAEQNYVGIGTLVDISSAEETGAGPHILYVFPGSGAEEANIQVRDQIVSVDGDPCVTIRAIRGPEGTTVKLGILTPGQPVREVEVQRRRIDPTITPISEEIGPDNSVGYLRLPSMEGQNTIDGVASVLAQFKTDGVKSLIIDVRSVALGGLGVTVAILAHLLDGDAGTFYSRAQTQPLTLPASDLLATFKDMPIVVLTDKDSSGEPERLAAILQSTGRAKVVGQETPGRTRVVQDVTLDDGSVLELVTASLQLPDGTKLERQGIKPDVAITDSWMDVSEANDPYILAALDLLSGSAAASPSPAPTASPAPTPSPSPSLSPSPAPSAAPSPSPTAAPSPSPSPSPSASPTADPSTAPTTTPVATKRPHKHK